MKGMILTAKEQNRLQVSNGVLERCWSLREAAEVMGVSERWGWRLLAAYRQEGASSPATRQQVVPLAELTTLVAVISIRFSLPSLGSEANPWPGRCIRQRCRADASSAGHLHR